MLRKFTRRTPRKGFAMDKTYHGIMLGKATPSERRSLVEASPLSKFFDDDLLCHMVIQKDKLVMNKLLNKQQKRLFPFYPSYIPLVDKSTIITMDEYYWISNTIEYPCVKCSKNTVCFIGDFSLKNVLCGECVSKHYMDSNNNFRQSKADKENSKKYVANLQKYFQINKDIQKRMFTKLMKRQRSFYDTKTTLDSLSLRKLTSITKVYNNLLK